MRRLLAMAAVCGVLLFVHLHQVEAASSKITLTESDYHFGKVKEGTEVTHKFTFKNEGDADLVITDVKTSCGCTAAVTSAKTIAPGKEGTLSVNFNSRGRRGPQTKTITIFSNDPVHPRVAVRIDGEVDAGDQAGITVTPMSLDIGVIPPGEPVVRELSVTNSGTADLVLEDFVGRNSVSVQDASKEKKGRTIKPRQTVKIKVVAKPNKKEGVYQGYLQIRNNSYRRIVTIPVYGYVSDKYELKPEYRSSSSGGK